MENSSLVEASRRIANIKAGKAVQFYVNKVLDGRVVAGPYVRAACQRHQDDLSASKRRNLYFSPEKAGRAIRFFENCLVFPDGPTAGKAFILQPWQKFIIGSIFGWLRGAENQPRRFKMAYIETGKGSGKSPLLAGIGLYMLVADGEQSAECYFGAVSRDQAKIAFRDASRMAENSKIIRDAVMIHANNIAYFQLGSFMRPISSEGRSLDGKRVHYCGLDELHEHPNAIVYEKMKLNTKGRAQPLIVMITNSGVDRSTVCFQNHDYSTRVASGGYIDDEWFSYVCALDEGDDPFSDEKCWVKANPNLGVSIPYSYIRQQVNQAKGMSSGSFANTVRRLNFCIWTEGTEQWISFEAWKRCTESFTDAELVGAECYAALDKGESRDLTALVMLFACTDGIARMRSYFWLPGDNLLEREEEEKAPYLAWRDMGVLRAIPGLIINDEWLMRDIATIFQAHQPKLLAFDRWRMDKLCLELGYRTGIDLYRKEQAESLDDAIRMSGDSMVMVDFGQGFRSMGPAVEETEKMIVGSTLRHDGNPIQTMCVLNARSMEDEAGNRKLVKPRGKQTARIDGAIAMVMACALLDQRRTGGLRGPSVYETAGLFAV